ncbi:hypothetical protein J2D73_06470 [Acetobacter sacchari]|uniref:Uncharacterized protein n=1 Tax=Acetobacter sacchari TaxID=2661687 RepID=A0ABS3LU48_9PROT|nr:hypothetical protein [Acetobacter sacchari]MBO1359440.1 hypothetical protein [Acetobacter sacchari]
MKRSGYPAENVPPARHFRGGRLYAAPQLQVAGSISNEVAGPVEMVPFMRVFR